jgi:hypothetical protein
MAEPVTGEVVLHDFEKPYFVGKECIFVLFGFAGEIETLIVRNTCVILTMLVKSGKLPPVNIPVFVRFTVEHIWIDPADSKTAIINPALSIFKKPATAVGCILCPYCIPGNVEYAVLIAEFGSWCRFKGSGIECPD